MDIDGDGWMDGDGGRRVTGEAHMGRGNAIYIYTRSFFFPLASQEPSKFHLMAAYHFLLNSVVFSSA
jgi:hypothetical protein